MPDGRRLGEILIAEGLIDEAQRSEAIALQVVAGGRLGTNLVELGFLGERDLARTLGRKHGVACASGAMTPDPTALSFASADWMDTHNVVPMRIDGNRLLVAVMDPGALAVFDELAFRSGLPVEQVVIPELRMNQLLRTHARAFREIRPVDLGVTRVPELAQGAVGGGAPAEELMSEEAFRTLYASMSDGEPPLVLGTSEADEPPLVAAEPPPLQFDEAAALLERCTGREDVAETVLRFARSRYARAILLSVQGRFLVGWRGAGLRSDAVRRTVFSLAEPGTFQLVCATRAHYVGPLRGPGGGALLAELGQPAPRSVVVLPLLVRNRLVQLLYLDAGPGEMASPDLGPLLILSHRVTRGYEQLIQRRERAQ